MKAIIAGSSGMIGNLVLTNCLNADKTTEVISLVRKPTGLTHKKLIEIVIEDFEDFSTQDDVFTFFDQNFFIIGEIGFFT